MINFTEMTNLVPYFVCLSASTQKITDLVKNSSPMKSMSDKVRQIFITVVSAVVAGASALVIPPEGMAGALSTVQLFLVAAVLGSSGSGVFNDAISILSSFKDQQKINTK